MKNYTLAIGIVLLGFTSGCKKEEKTIEVVEDVKEIVVDKSKLGIKTELTIALEPKSESNVSGEVKFTLDKYNYVKMVANITGLTPGTHAIHIHENADCSSIDGKSAGGHWNPTGQPHGEWKSKKGFHKGDIGNFVANQQGEGLVTMHTNEWCIGCDDVTKNIIGKAIIIHEGFDDLSSQPSGAAGKRVSCAGIIK
ncbi:superoxide dismutase family protein [Aurantibacter sp.]|uniref:superoxide dismutase family protein n=1 Tax=Aurantibacter sp. TaxID=2807103 RepID=UPI0035C8211F